jgi:hypothetical protein
MVGISSLKLSSLSSTMDFLGIIRYIMRNKIEATPKNTRIVVVMGPKGIKTPYD